MKRQGFKVTKDERMYMLWGLGAIVWGAFAIWMAYIVFTKDHGTFLLGLSLWTHGWGVLIACFLMESGYDYIFWSRYYRRRDDAFWFRDDMVYGEYGCPWMMACLFIPGSKFWYGWLIMFRMSIIILVRLVTWSCWHEERPYIFYPSRGKRPIIE